MVHPLAVEVLRQLATEHGVCARPLALRRTDPSTGLTEVIDLPCGATREDKCPACAKRAKRLRQDQCREGWHRSDEPLPGPQEPDEGQQALIRTRAHFVFERGRAEMRAEWDQLADLDQGIREIDEAITESGLRGRLTPVTPVGDDQAGDDEDEQRAGRRRVRSTRRRQDAPDLPRHPVRPVTVGRTFTGRDGRVFQPSTFLTVTLDSYGAVWDDGTPVDPDSYDYQRAAWDAIHLPRLLDRFWQNLRRAVGWNVQYFGSVEPQRRLAPHAHFAMRGTIARALIRQVAAATYHHVWWPPVDLVRYEGRRLADWDEERKQYIDPHTRMRLTTWDEALDELDADPDAAPVHVVRFGAQIDVQGVLAGTPKAEKLIGYLTKYLTKAVDQCHRIDTDRQQAHADRLWHALRFVPCSPRCANWLRYGIQPHKARKGLRPGHCKGRAHQRGTLGMGGRRVLVSREWSGKTLADHRYDVRAWVRALLGQTLDYEASAVIEHEPGTPVHYAWEIARPDDRDVPPLQHRLLRAISAKVQQRQQLRAALEQVARNRDQPPDAASNNGQADVSATTTREPADHDAPGGPQQPQRDQATSETEARTVTPRGPKGGWEGPPQPPMIILCP